MRGDWKPGLGGCLSCGREGGEVQWPNEIGPLQLAITWHKKHLAGELSILYSDHVIANCIGPIRITPLNIVDCLLYPKRRAIWGWQRLNWILKDAILK